MIKINEHMNRFYASPGWRPNLIFGVIIFTLINPQIISQRRYYRTVTNVNRKNKIMFIRELVKTARD